MSITHKESYEPPICEVLEVKGQSIICQSGNTEQYSNTNDPDWGF